MGWNIRFSLSGEPKIEIRACDPGQTHKVSWYFIELAQEQEWRNFLKIVREAGKKVGWEE